MGNYEREEEASWCTTVCLAASFLIPSNAASLSFLHPCTFFLGIDDTRRGNFLFFSKTKKRGLKVVSCAKFAYYSECKSGFSHFPSFFFFCVWLWLRQQFVWCPSKLLSLWETKQWCESLCYYDGGISLQIVTEIQIFLSPYFQKILQERLENLTIF